MFRNPFQDTQEKECRTCEILKESLHYERALNRELLDKLLKKDVTEIKSESHEPIFPKLMPWSVRRAQLEKESRVLAEKLETEKLEKEMKLDIPDATGTKSSS